MKNRRALPTELRDAWLKKSQKVLLKKLLESLIAVLPVVAIVLVVYFTPLVSLTTKELVAFVVSSVFLIIGIGFFNLGADMAMTPMGEHIGGGLTKSGNFKLLIFVCFIMGVLITVAEPDLSVLAEQVKTVMNGTTLIVTVGVGVGLFLLVSVVKIVTKKNLSSLLMFFYMVLFSIVAVMAENGFGSFMPLAFDSGGVTTGPITVPFIMALGVGIAASIGGKESEENSFGLIALCSIGPMLAVSVLSLTTKGELGYVLADYSVEGGIGSNFVPLLLSVMADVGKALGLIVVFFVVLQLTVLKLPKQKIVQITVGIIYTFLGLVIFLTAASVGFMPVGFRLGEELARSKTALIIFAFVVGAVVVLAEPAVHVLNRQVEQITLGTVTKRSMTIALSLGVGLSIGLSIIRIIYGFSLLYYIIPGYCLSLGLSFFVPKLYTAIAFDSGGVASGPMASSFILPFAIGACATLNGADRVLDLAFGVVAMVAMTPLITIQALGFKSVVATRLREKGTMKRIISADDEQIIDFM